MQIACFHDFLSMAEVLTKKNGFKVRQVFINLWPWLIWNGQQPEEMQILTFRPLSYFLRHRLPRGGGYHPLRFSIWFKILYSVIQRLIQNYLLS